MNPVTGQIYRGEEAAQKIASGEAVEVSKEVAHAVELGMRVTRRNERRRQERKAGQRRTRTKFHRPNW